MNINFDAEQTNTYAGLLAQFQFSFFSFRPLSSLVADLK
jgi:hypothetical protein